MSPSPADLRTLATGVVTRIRTTEASFLAAAVAYYAFVSLLPLLVLAFVVGTALAGEAMATALVDRIASVLSPAGRSVVRDALTARSGRGSVGVIGVILLLWGATKVVRGLSRAIARVYGTGPDESLVDTVVTAVLTLGVGAVAAGFTVATASVIRTVTGPVGIVASLGLPLVLFATFIPLYVLLPTVPVTVRQALPGAVVAAVGWSVLGTAFGVYTTVVGPTVYGVLGAVLLLVTWLYLGALILIVGATVNAVLASEPMVTNA